MKQQKDSVELGPTWGLRLIESLPMDGFSHDLLTELELKTLKQHSEKAASAYEIVLGNYCVQKRRADASDSEIERLTTENKDLKREVELETVNTQTSIAGLDMLVEIRRLKHKCNSLLKTMRNTKPGYYPSRQDLQWEAIE
jgi:cell division protein FtsB